ncbi:hypothetical protein CY34DRAFT_803431 [Suillus luteus UH-Slu-Lm8-n1]|uniref:Uncharacterized protein n=1 Tax=Suillus luteus UH-Slu-Lm8-n1 TaxID=930992 RepID=A0A0D0BKM8_9AGAM|nr:hypothetical protein CY34DRAFT_803431 [Suillus luteus UH-Slu-Lm8-n1]
MELNDAWKKSCGTSLCVMQHSNLTTNSLGRLEDVVLDRRGLGAAADDAYHQ